MTFTIIEAPSILGLFPGGVERLPEALLGAGLSERLGAVRFGRLEPPPYKAERDPETLVLNSDGIARYSVDLAERVGATLDDGSFPVVLGGDCSVLLGNLLALRRRGRYGLLFLDGHADFYQPEAEPNGEAASMDLALATGRGPSLLTDIEGLRPLVRDEDVVALGRRDHTDTERYGSQRIEESGICVLDLPTTHAMGTRNASELALEHLTKVDLSGFWIHLDVDVLDDALMPAVDYRIPGGLSFDELTTILRMGMNSGRAVGINITIFNPELDGDGSIARAFTNALIAGLR